MGETFITIAYSDSYGTQLQRARRLTSKEAMGYKPEWVDEIFIGVGDPIELEHIKLTDCPNRNSDGAFPGCSNMAWIVTEKESEEFISTNERKGKAKKLSQLKERMLFVSKQIHKLDNIHLYKTKEEARQAAFKYNLIQNEGGDGYVPAFYSEEDLDLYKRELEILKTEEKEILR